MMTWTKSGARNFLTTAYIDAVGPLVKDRPEKLEEDVVSRIQDPTGSATIVNFLLLSAKFLAGDAVYKQDEANSPDAMDQHACTEDELCEYMLRITSAADFLNIGYDPNIMPQL